MKKWAGKMKAKGLNAEVVVFHEDATELERGIWYGHGVSTTLFTGGKYLMTDIGEIMIGLNKADLTGLGFDFVGSGKPILV